jgi:hypothetical protein
MSADEILVSACASGVVELGSTQLLLISASAANANGSSAEEILEAACDSGLDDVSQRELLVIIAQLLNL